MTRKMDSITTWCVLIAAATIFLSTHLCIGILTGVIFIQRIALDKSATKQQSSELIINSYQKIFTNQLRNRLGGNNYEKQKHIQTHTSKTII